MKKDRHALSKEADTAPHPAPTGWAASGETEPVPELDGLEEFVQGGRNWITFDHQRGKLSCRNLNADFEEFTGTILESQVVRVMKDEDGTVTCTSSDRVTADRGRPGKVCATCEDRDIDCARRWRISWQDAESGLLFAHTLSQTGSLNFHHYATTLLNEGFSPSEVTTRIFIEEARRQKTGTLYRRLQFAREDPFAD